MSDKWNRLVLTSLCEKIQEQVKTIIPNDFNERIRLYSIMKEAEKTEDVFKQFDDNVNI